MPFQLLTVRHIFEIGEVVNSWTKVTRPQSLMNFALRCVRISPGVNCRAELVTLVRAYSRNGASHRLARGICNDSGIYINKIVPTCNYVNSNYYNLNKLKTQSLDACVWMQHNICKYQSTHIISSLVQCISELSNDLGVNFFLTIPC